MGLWDSLLILKSYFLKNTNFCVGEKYRWKIFLTLKQTFCDNFNPMSWLYFEEDLKKDAKAENFKSAENSQCGTNDFMSETLSCIMYDIIILF